jgi:hypothetical protein
MIVEWVKKLTMLSIPNGHVTGIRSLKNLRVLIALEASRTE